MEDHDHARHGHDEREHEEPVAGWRLFGFGNKQILLVAISTTALGIGFLGQALQWPAPAVRACFLVAILAGAVEIVPAGVEWVVKDHSLDINFLVTVAVIGAVALGEWSEAATVVALFSLGEA